MESTLMFWYTVVITHTHSHAPRKCNQKYIYINKITWFAFIIIIVDGFLLCVRMHPPVSFIWNLSNYNDIVGLPFYILNYRVRSSRSWIWVSRISPVKKELVCVLLGCCCPKVNFVSKEKKWFFSLITHFTFLLHAGLLLLRIIDTCVYYVYNFVVCTHFPACQHIRNGCSQNSATNHNMWSSSRQLPENPSNASASKQSNHSKWTK